jgi:hypothetical protein
MKEKQLHIAPNFSISASDYANQANAILGIKKAGKSYTAMKAAEELMDAGIPILAFDPIGIWKNLKNGVGKHKGYPVVVAGGEGSDIILTTDNAKDIVRAAMKENVNLVIDLYSRELSNKSTWIKVVQETIHLLLYENEPYGIRHIFLEEAAEFIPQRVQPQHGKVYDSIERLARMGRNVGLGLTIINQRAEEINKAILEICDLSLLHRQVGKNSLLSINKWLEVRQIEGYKDIVGSLPVLERGQCYVIGNNEKPFKIKVSAKNTFHPDPNVKKEDVSKVSFLKRDVGQFVDKLRQQLEKPKAPAKETKAAVRIPVNGKANPNSQLSEKIKNLENQVKQYKAESYHLKKAIQVYEERSTNLAIQLTKIAERLTDSHGIKVGGVIPLQTEISTDIPKNSTDIPKIDTKFPKTPTFIPPAPGNGSLGKCSREIIRFLAQYNNRQFSKAQVAVATGYSVTSGGFNNSISELYQKGFIIRNSKLAVNPNAMAEIVSCIGEITHQDYNIETYKNNLAQCERKIYELLLEHPDQLFSKNEIAEATGYSPGSGGFSNSLSRLNTLELIEKENGSIRLNHELLELG